MHTDTNWAFGHVWVGSAFGRMVVVVVSRVGVPFGRLPAGQRGVGYSSSRAPCNTSRLRAVAAAVVACWPTGVELHSWGQGSSALVVAAASTSAFALCWDFHLGALPGCDPGAPPPIQPLVMHTSSVVVHTGLHLP